MFQIMRNAVGFLGACECSSKIVDHKLRERSIYMLLIFSSNIQLLGQRCRESGQLSLIRVGV